MAIYIIPKRVQRVWDTWDTRFAVLVSLFLQILLILFAGTRKRTGRIIISIIVWSAYLMADWTAIFAIGLITKNQNNDVDKIRVSGDVATFWAPFLLLHLGGPDSVTAFSNEDNELWIRHLFGLIVQLALVVYALLLAFPNPFWIPSILVFLAGTIKYAERTVALYRASSGNLKSSFGSEPETDIVTPDWGNKLSSDLNEIKAVKYGYTFYNLFRGFIVDGAFGSSVVEASVKFFSKESSRDAFRVMEVELNFMYDELFTKMRILHNTRFHYFGRGTCTALLWAAFLLFTFHNKPKIHTFDSVVSYALLVGAIVLDFIALIKVVFSDWMVTTVENSTALRLMNAMRKMLFSRARWSGRIYQHNLIRYTLRRSRPAGWLDHVVYYLGLKNTYEELLDKYHRPLCEGLKERVFNDLKDSAEKDAADQRICSQRGGTTVDHYESTHQCDLGIIKWSVSQVEYDHSILLWHIATNLLYYNGRLNHQESQNNQDGGLGSNLRDNEACKILSEYMMYLLVMRPTLVTPLVSSAVFRTKYDTVCRQANQHILIANAGVDEKGACALLEYWIDNAVSLESLLYQALKLAEKLKSIEEDMWETMRKVWVELLCYGARHCRGSAHAHHLTKGGELITFVSLLMHHFGLSDSEHVD